MSSISPRSDALNIAKKKLDEYQKKYSAFDSVPQKSENLNPKILTATDSMHFANPALSNNEERLSFSGMAESINLLAVERNNLHRTLLTEQTKYTDLQDVHVRILNENASLRKELAELNEQLSLSTTTTISVSKELHTSMIEVASLKKVISEKNNHLKQSEQKINKLETNLYSKNEECERIKSLHHESTPHSTKEPGVHDKHPDFNMIEQQKEEIEILNIKLESVKNELSICQQQLSGSNSRNEESSRQIDILEHKLDDLNNKHLLKLESMVFERDNLSRKCFDLEQQMDSNSHKNDSKIKTMNEELNAIVKQKDTIITDLMRKLERLNEALLDKKVLMDKLNVDREIISKSLSQNEQMKKMLFHYQNEIKLLQDQNVQLNLKCDRFEQTDKNAKFSAVDLCYWQHLLTEKSEQLLHFGYLLKRTADDSFLEMRDAKLNNYHEELINANKDLLEKNIHLKNVNADLSRSIDDYCLIIKQLNSSLVELKEQNSYIKMQNNSNLSLLGHDSSSDGSVVNQSDQLKQLQRDKMILQEHIQDLTTQLEIIKSTSLSQIKSEALAKLNRQVSSLLREKILLESSLDQLSHKNTILSEECNAIGDYISLYISRKQGLKNEINEICASLHTTFLSFLELMSSTQEMLLALQIYVDNSTDSNPAGGECIPKVKSLLRANIHKLFEFEIPSFEIYLKAHPLPLPQNLCDYSNAPEVIHRLD